MMMKLVFATNNKNKLNELRGLLPEDIDILTLDDIGCYEDIEETADTLEGNAKIKSDYIKNTYAYDCFADDTGLEVAALGGAPGVYSARYSGEGATAESNIKKLLSKLRANGDRKARFRTVMSLFLNGEQHFFEGICKGKIEKSPSGNQGFGYDPVFIPDGYDKTFAEMDMATKGKISHRGIAVKKFITFLKESI